MNGEKQKAMQAPNVGHDVQIAVGSKDYPLGIIYRSEIDSFLTPQFFRLYDIFEKFEMGFGLPIFGKSWAEHPKWMIDAIGMFKAEYKKLTR